MIVFASTFGTLCIVVTLYYIVIFILKILYIIDITEKVEVLPGELLYLPVVCEIIIIIVSIKHFNKNR
jgi:hypothetical protein